MNKYCDELVFRYLKDQKGYHASVLKGANVGKAEHRSEGIVIPVTHQPMEKYRVVIPLKTPFVFADQPGSLRQGQQKWKQLYLGAAELLDLQVDRSCTDPSRIYYFPRHAKGAPYVVDYVDGEPLDWENIELPPPVERSKQFTKSTAKKFANPWLKRFLAQYGKTFDAEAFFGTYLEERDPSGTGGCHFECPNDGAHSNAGDPDDTGFVAVSAHNNEGGNGFSAFCMHDSCRDMDRADFLDLVITDYGLKEADLLEFVEEATASSTSELLEQMEADAGDTEGLEEPSSAYAWLPDGFYERDGKFYRRRGSEGENKLIGDAFNIIGKARDVNGTSFSLILEVRT